MKKEQIFYLNGQKVKSLVTFGKELRNIFFFDEKLNLKSLDVINDVLRGGFGTLDYNEKYTVLWQNYKKSELALDPELLDAILHIFNDNPNITLVCEKKSPNN